MKRDMFFLILAVAVLLLSLVPVGGAVFVLGFGFGDSPCVLCWAQRTGMVLLALIGVFVLRYGPRPKYLGLAVLIAAWGLHMGVRHSAGHVVRDVGQGFSIPILGAHTYIWSILIYWAALVAMGVMLLVMRDGAATRNERRLTPLDHLAMGALLLVVAGNIVQALASTGPPPFMGQSDPVRFSFDPRNWVWSTEEWSPAPTTWRGRWAIEAPDPSTRSGDVASGPFDSLPTVTVKRKFQINVPLKGEATDLACDAATAQCLLTTAHGVYVTNTTLSTISRYTVVDPGFSVDMDEFAGAAFLDAHTVLALSRNKSFVVLRAADGADARKNFRFFLESFSAFDEVTRSRFSTVRAKMMYVLSVAFDPQRNSLYTITVPNQRVKQLVVSRFDRRDMTLSEEFTPAVSDALGSRLRQGRSLADLYVTGATVADGRLYAISAAHNVLLTIDPTTHTIVSASAVPELDHPTGIAAFGQELMIVNAAGGVMVVDRPVAPLAGLDVADK